MAATVAPDAPITTLGKPMPCGMDEKVHEQQQQHGLAHAQAHICGTWQALVHDIRVISLRHDDDADAGRI